MIYEYLYIACNRANNRTAYKIASDSGAVLWAVDRGSAELNAACDPQGNLFLAGYKVSDETIAKYDIDGNKVLSLYPRAVGSYEYAIAVDKVGNIFGAGQLLSSAAVFMLDSEGSVEWLGIHGGTGYAATPTEDGDHVLFSGATASSVSTRLLDITDGSTVWDADHGAATYGAATDLDGNCYICGIRTSNVTHRKYNAAGVLQWSSDFGDTTYRIDTDDDYVYVTGIYNNSKNVGVYNKSDGVEAATYSVYDSHSMGICTNRDGGFYAGEATTTGGRVAKFDTDGTKLWEVTTHSAQVRSITVPPGRYGAGLWNIVTELDVATSDYIDAPRAKPYFVTFTRATGATYFDSDGVLQTADSGDMRHDHDPLTGEYKGWWLEGESTNLWTYSEVQDTGWAFSATSVDAVEITAPDNETTGQLIKEDISTGLHWIRRTTAFTAGVTYCASFRFKDAGRKAYVYHHTNAFGVNTGLRVNIGSKTIEHEYGNVIESVVRELPNDWIEVWFTATATTTTSTFTYITMMNDDNETSYEGDGASGFYLWGCQLEVGAHASSYIKTVAAAVTRNADLTKIDGDAFSSWWNAPEGTFYVEGVWGPEHPDPSDAQKNQRLIEMYKDSGGDHRIAIGSLAGASTPGNLAVFVRTTSQVNFGDGPITPYSAYKVAVALKANDHAVAMDGSIVGTDSTVGMPSGITGMSIGVDRALSLNWLNGHIKHIIYWPERLSNTDLEILTTPDSSVGIFSCTGGMEILSSQVHHMVDAEMSGVGGMETTAPYVMAYESAEMSGVGGCEATPHLIQYASAEFTCTGGMTATTPSGGIAAAATMSCSGGMEARANVVYHDNQATFSGAGGMVASPISVLNSAATISCVGGMETTAPVVAVACSATMDCVGSFEATPHIVWLADATMSGVGGMIVAAPEGIVYGGKITFSGVGGMRVKRVVIPSLHFRAYIDGVQRTDLSGHLFAFSSTDWRTYVFESDTSLGLPIAHNLRWNSEGSAFVKDVQWDVAPDNRRREIIPPPGIPGRYVVRSFYVTYIGTGTLVIYVNQKIVKTIALDAVTKKTRKHYYLPAGTYGRLVMYDYLETSKDSVFVFNVEWEATLLDV